MADQQLQYGKPILQWSTTEYKKHDRSFAWYLIAALVGGGLLIYAIFSGSFPFAVVILMIGIILLLSHMKDPRDVKVYITTNGVLVGSHFYSYKEIKDFSIVYEPPDVKVLYIDFMSVLHPLLSIPLEDENPNKVRETLLPYVIENLERDDETLTDMVARLYKL